MSLEELMNIPAIKSGAEILGPAVVPLSKIALDEALRIIDQLSQKDPTEGIKSLRYVSSDEEYAKCVEHFVSLGNAEQLARWNNTQTFYAISKQVAVGVVLAML